MEKKKLESTLLNLAFVFFNYYMLLKIGNNKLYFDIDIFLNYIDWVGKVIHRKWCKKLKSDPTSKWNMRKPEYILEK